MNSWWQLPTHAYRRVAAQEGAPAIRASIRLDDALLTGVLLLIATGDISLGIATAANTEWSITQLGGLNSTVITPELIRVWRLQGLAAVEAGTAWLAFGLYRVWRWQRGLEFNGYNFTFLFAFGAAGRSIAISSLTPSSAPGYMFRATRVGVLWCSFFLSLYTYRESWSRI